MKRTCLYEAHVELGGKMVEFAGYEMPIQYEGITPEHNATRNNIGLFDVSHMGKFYISGDKATEAINRFVTNDISSMSIGQAVYSPMCYEDGGTVDDILIYKLEDDHYMLVVNASNKDKDYVWIKNTLGLDIAIKDKTESMCQIAVQGPKATQLLTDLLDISIDDMKYYWFKDNIELFGIPVLISRTGYTGEDGYELYFDAEHGQTIWHKLLDSGKIYSIAPCGLGGARDTLRFEAGMPLYGNELSETINPVEAGLSYFIKLDKDYFVGKQALLDYKNNKTRKLIGFELTDKGIARHGATVLNDAGEIIGHVTTGYKSPTLDITLGFALINSNHENEQIKIQVRKRILNATIVNKRFLKKQNLTIT